MTDMLKASFSNLRLSKLEAAQKAAADGAKTEGPRHYGHVVMQCMTGSPHYRAPPLAPDALETMLREGVARETAEPGTGLRFTNAAQPSDLMTVCLEVYTAAFLRVLNELGSGRTLMYQECDWGDAEA